MAQDTRFPVGDWMPVVKRLAWVRARTYGLDHQDLRQELVLVLLERPFDAGKYTPEVWIHLQIREAVRRLAGPRRRSKEQYGLIGCSDDGNRRGGPKRSEDDDMPTIMPLIEAAPDARPSHESLVDDQDEVEFVLSLVNNLPPPLSAVVRMRLTDGLTFEQIGEMLGIGRDTASLRYQEAVERTRRLVFGVRPDAIGEET